MYSKMFLSAAFFLYEMIKATVLAIIFYLLVYLLVRDTTTNYFSICVGHFICSVINIICW